jgi:hypothetical protein
MALSAGDRLDPCETLESLGALRMGRYPGPHRPPPPSTSVPHDQQVPLAGESDQEI